MPWKPNQYGPVRAWLPWEIELLRGAMAEHAAGDTQALNDCASMLCRSRSSVRDRAYKFCDVIVVMHPVKVTRAPVCALPSSFHKPTPAELMSGVGHKRPSHFREALRGFA